MIYSIRIAFSLFVSYNERCNMLPDMIYEDMVFRVRANLTKLSNKIMKESSFEIDPEDFQKAVREAIEECIEPPKKPGGQPYNNNAMHK